MLWKAILLCSLFAISMAQAQVAVTSPDGKVKVDVSRHNDGRLMYAVQFQGNKVLLPSPIGVIVDGVDCGADIGLGKEKTEPFKVEFPWQGNHTEVKLSGNAAVIPIRGKAGKNWRLEVKCFDDGVAYRCIIPGAGSRKVTGEATAWNLPEGTFAWCNPETGTYEGIHLKHAIHEIPADKFKKGIAMPTTLELPDGGFALITEAAVTGYSGMTLERTGTWQLKSAFLDDEKGWAMSGEIKTPWRVLLLAADLNSLVNNDIVPALCPPPDAKLFPDAIRTEWIKPGRCLWQWWAYDDAGTHWSKQKQFVDKAAELKCQYYLVDEGWQHTRQEWASEGKSVWDRMKELCDYAAGKGVGIWVWQGWKFHERRQWPGLETPAKREEFFRRCAEVGIKGAKIDFMEAESQEMLAFYEDCRRVAAKHKVMVNFHGANKPAGERRTWPNEMTREGVRGLEYNKWSTLPPSHYATLPFTRFVVGAGDFTPTTFQEKMLKGTTFAQQLAGSIVYISPILCWADKPEMYLESPAVEVIRSVPPVWDETVVLPDSKIGDLAAFARRSGKQWFVGVLNGGKAREITLDFSFLGNGAFTADFYGDVEGKPAQFDVQKQVKVDASTKKTVRLNDGGGFVAWIRP